MGRQIAMRERYIRNAPLLTEDDMKTLDAKRAAVVGCGGLGGYVIEELCRLGLGHITIIDGDVFTESNLNRQLYSEESNLGAYKAEEAKKRISRVNGGVEVDIHNTRLTKENAHALLCGHDVIMDAVDNVGTRLLLQDCCDELGIPLVHGAIGGWFAQVSTVFPGDGTLRRIYQSSDVSRAVQSGAVAFMPAIAASVEVAEAVKVLLKKRGLLRNKILVMNLLEHTYHVIEL